MKRAHANRHRLIWLILTPIMIAILLMAITARPSDSVDEAIPEILIEEAGDVT